MTPDLRWLDEAPVPMAATRGDVVLYANAAAGRLFGVPPAELAGRAVDEFFPPEGRAASRERRRLVVPESETMVAAYDITVLARGVRLPVRVQVARLGDVSLIQYIDVTDATFRDSRMEALARLGAQVQRERSVAEIQAALQVGLRRLGLRSLLIVPGEGSARVVLADVGEESAHRKEAALGEPLEGLTRPLTAFLGAAWASGAAYAGDYRAEVCRFLDRPREALFPPGPELRAIALRLETGGVPSALVLVAGSWFTPSDVPILRLLGTQVSAALDAVDDAARLAERQSELDALGRVAAAAGEAEELGAFVARASAEARQAAGALGVVAYLVERDGEALAAALPPRDLEQLPPVLRRSTLGGRFAGRALREDRTLLLQADELPGPGPELARGLGAATVAAIPLKFRSRPQGVLLVAWAEPREARHCRLPLLEAMGGHFAAAIASHRLVADLRGRVEELSLLNETARDAATLDLGSLLDAALRRVAAAFGADVAGAFRKEGDAVFPLARIGFSPATRAVTERIPVDTPAGDRVYRQLQPLQVPGDAIQSPPGRTVLEVEGLARMVIVPLVFQGRALGSLLLGRRADVPFTEGEVARLRAVGGQLGAAVENARLYADVRRRLEEQGLVLEVGRSLSGTLDLSQVLEAGIRNLTRLIDARHGYLMFLDPTGRQLELRADHEGLPVMKGHAMPVDPPDGSLVSRVFAGRQAMCVEDADLDPRAARSVQRRAPARGWLGLPLMARSRCIGVAVLVDPDRPRRFSAEEVERASAIAAQLAVAADNARLYDDLRRSYEELAQAQRQLVHRERLAALGELSAVVAHEVRNPLGAIFNAVGALRRLTPAGGDARMLVEVVGEESDRLNRIVGDLLDFARPSKPSFRPARVEALVDEALATGLAEPPPGVEVVREIAPGLPPVVADARQLRQALLNLALNALQAMPGGGRLVVRARREGDQLRLEVADSGPGIPAGIRDRVFEPFFSTRATGTGLGLAVVKRVAEDHRGSVAVEEPPGGGAALVLRLPLLLEGAADADVEKPADLASDPAP